MFDINVIAPAFALIAPLGLIVSLTLARPRNIEQTPHRRPSTLSTTPATSPLYQLLMPPHLDLFWKLMTIGFFSVVLAKLVSGYVAPQPDGEPALRALGNLFGLAIMLTIVVGVPINALRNRAAIRALRSKGQPRPS